MALYSNGGLNSRLPTGQLLAIVKSVIQMSGIRIPIVSEQFVEHLRFENFNAGLFRYSDHFCILIDILFMKVQSYSLQGQIFLKN